MSWSRAQSDFCGVGGVDHYSRIAYAIAVWDEATRLDSTGGMPMTPSQATAEVFLTALRALPDEERQAVLAHIVDDDEWQEDIKDLAVFSRRREAASHPFRTFLHEHGTRNNGP
jgi:hypothetical protein